MEKSCRTSPSVHHCSVAPPTPSVWGRGVVNGKFKGGGTELEVRSQRPDSCETGGKFLPQRGDTLTKVSGSTSSGTQAARRGKSSNCLTFSQLRLHNSQFNYIEGSDVCVHVCYENVFALQLHVECAQVRSDVRQQV